MILKPTLTDIRIISYYIGRVLLGYSLVMLIPVVVGFLFREVNPCFDFLIGLDVALICGFFLVRTCFTEREINTMHGMVIVSVSWLAVMVLGAIPLSLSGHYQSFLDACFEAMSGLTTTGLTLVQDLDHLSYTHNLWRHLGPFVGGQGIVIVVLAFGLRVGAGVFNLYVGEARDEKLLPNVIHTARFIWFISIVYLVIGTVLLGITGMFIGLKPPNAFFHAACIFMAGFDTAGFAPQSQNVLFYHSFIYEIVIIMFMIFGSLNFNLHYQIWFGRRKEIWKNIETRTFLLSTTLLFLIVAVGLSKLDVYTGTVAFFRKGFFQLISAHTTTGYMSIYARQFIGEWGNLAFFALIVAMALGGSACSTAGGIKMLRVGIAFKALWEDIKKANLPDSAVFFQKFHHIKDMFLEDRQVCSMVLITVCYIVLYGIGTLAGMFCGYSFSEALFESTSAAANVGLSCGITDVSMPTILKVVYIVQMWVGRLEFMSVFVLIGLVVATIKGRR